VVKRLKHDFHVARASEADAVFLQFLAEFAIIINFPIINEDSRAIFRQHRLGRGFGQIENSQPPVSEGHPSLLPDANAVWAAVLDRGKH
jgi:hypothetical protein